MALKQWSYLQGQGAHIAKICSLAMTPYVYVGCGKYFTQSLSIVQGYVMSLDQGHISNVKVMHNAQNPFPDRHFGSG